jgi:hypothetical protein
MSTKISQRTRMRGNSLRAGSALVGSELVDGTSATEDAAK